MDVEGSEWSSLHNMLSSNILSRVKQFGLEIHVKPHDTRLYEYWTILHELERQGFRRWYWAMNYRGINLYMASTGSRSHCYEMVYINVNFLHKNSKYDSAIPRMTTRITSKYLETSELREGATTLPGRFNRPP